MSDAVMGRFERLPAELEPMCIELVKKIGLRQGSIEVHCHEGRPVALHVLDKGIKFKEAK